MRLRTRLTAAVAAVASAGTFAIGGLSISSVRSSQIEALDHTLFVVTAQVQANPKDPLAAALLAVDQSPTALALGFVAAGSAFAWVRELPDAAIAAPSASLRAAAEREPQTTPAGFRVSSITLPDGETLVVAGSMQAIDTQTRADIVRLATIWLVLIVLMGAFIRGLVSRDVRHIELLVDVAGRVADGDPDVSIPARGPSAEVRELASALQAMVASLQHAVVVEQQATQRMQEFLGDASHELRTPLTVIKGYLELLERSPDVDPAQRERAMTRMRAEAARMEMLVNDILMLAEIGASQPEVLERIDLTALVRVMADDLRQLQPERPVEVAIGGGVAVRGQPEHVQRAITNAFSNIQRHTRVTDAVRVGLSSDGANALLTIEDGGPGLSAAMYEKGIAHFQRFDPSRARTTGGSGLGMSIMAAVMQESGGSVEISPSELGGLRLELRFPVAP